MPRRTPLTALTLVAIILTTATPAHANEGPPAPRTLLIGNSLLASFTDELQPQLPGAMIDGRPGTGLTDPASTTNWYQQLAAYEADMDPDTVVIELGTNDAPTVARGVDYRPYVDRLLAETDAARVLWSTCSTHTADPTRNQGCAAINTVLHDVDRPGFAVIEMDAVIYTDPDNICCESVHLSQQGQDQAAALFAWATRSK